MANESLIVGNSNWAVKANNLLGYAVGETSGYYVPRELNFTRNSTATYTDENGIIQTAAANIARVQDNALLLEPQRTNLLTYSEEFDDSSWSKIASTITANSTTSPDGTINANTLSDSVTTSNSTYTIVKSINFVSGTAYTASIYAKNIDRRYIYIRFVSTAFTTDLFAFFDLQNGVVVSTSTGVNAKIEESSNGFYRCIATATATVTTSSAFIYGLSSNGSNNVYINSEVKSVYIWGAQLEVGSYPTSYIKTTNATATRLADTCSKTGISSLIGQTQGTLFFEFGINGSQSIGRNIGFISDGSINNQVGFYFFNNQLTARIRSNAASVFDLNKSAVANGRHKVALAYKSGDCAFYLDGTLVSTNTATFNFSTSLSQVTIGSNVANVDQLGEGIYKNTIFTTRLSNAELASMTTL